MKKITAYSIHTTAEGERAAFTYSEIDSNGVIVKQNERAEVILVDPAILEAANKIYDFLLEKIPD